MRSLPALAAPLPDPPDSWTEYINAPAAMADGWMRECSLSQAITVDANCAVEFTLVGPARNLVQKVLLAR